MADFNNPLITSLYADVISEFKARDDNIATMFSTGTFSNIPTGSIQWDSTNRKFTKWDGTAFINLEATYAINVDSLGGFAASAFLRLSGANVVKTAGILTLQINSATPLLLKSGTVENCYLPFYANTADQATRSGYVGYGSTVSKTLHLANNTADANINLATTGTTANLSVVDINGRILFDRGHGSAGAGSDMLLTGTGLIATQEHMYFNIDSDASGVGLTFSWRHNAETTAGAELMRLTDNGQLDLIDGLLNVKTSASSSLYLDQTGGSSYSMRFRIGGVDKWQLGVAFTDPDFRLYNSTTGRVSLIIADTDDNLFTTGNTLHLGTDATAASASIVNFRDQNSATYRALQWNNTNNRFELANNSGLMYKILTEEDRKFSPVVSATGTDGTTAYYWYKIADVTTPGASDGLSVKFDILGSNHGQAATVHASFYSNAAPTTSTSFIHVIGASEAYGSNLGAYSDGNFKIIQSTLGIWEIWGQLGTIYSAPKLYQNSLIITGGSTITWLATSPVQLAEPVGTGTNYYAKMGIIANTSYLLLGKGYVANAVKVWDGSAMQTVIHGGGGQTINGTFTSTSLGTFKADAGGRGMELVSNSSWVSGTLNGPGLLWREADGTDIAGIRGYVDASDINHLQLGTDWLTSILDLDGSSGASTLTGNFDISGNLSVRQADTVTTVLELGTTNAAALIDFHSASTYNGYDARIQATGGTGGTSGQGTLLIESAALYFRSTSFRIGTSTDYATMTTGAGGAGNSDITITARDLYLDGQFSPASKVSSTSYLDAAIEIRELSRAGLQASAITASPRLAFNWGGAAAAQIGMQADGVIRTFLGDVSEGYADFAAGSITAEGGLTVGGDLSISSAGTARLLLWDTSAPLGTMYAGLKFADSAAAIAGSLEIISGALRLHSSFTASYNHIEITTGNSAAGVRINYNRVATTDLDIIFDSKATRTYNTTITLSTPISSYDTILVVGKHSTAGTFSHTYFKSSLLTDTEVYKIWGDGAGNYSHYTKTDDSTLTFKVEQNSWIYAIYGICRLF